MISKRSYPVLNDLFISNGIGVFNLHSAISLLRKSSTQLLFGLKPNTGVVILKGEPSFSADSQILIDELSFYIRNNNLKAD